MVSIEPYHLLIPNEFFNIGSRLGLISTFDKLRSVSRISQALVERYVGQISYMNKASDTK